MYTIVKRLNGTFLCIGKLQDGTERWEEQSLDTAVQSLKKFAKTMNGARGKLTVYYRCPPTALPESLAARVLVREDHYLELRFEKGGDSIIEILDALRASGAEVIDLKTEEADLEDVFVALLRSDRSGVAGKRAR